MLHAAESEFEFGVRSFRFQTQHTPAILRTKHTYNGSTVTGTGKLPNENKHTALLMARDCLFVCLFVCLSWFFFKVAASLSLTDCLLLVSEWEMVL